MPKVSQKNIENEIFYTVVALPTGSMKDTMYL